MPQDACRIRKRIYGFLALRVPFDFVCSQDLFRPKVDEAFECLEGFAAIVDDILVYSSSKDPHDDNLRHI